MPQGSWLKTHGQEKIGARARAWGTHCQSFLGHEAWALSHEPVTISNRLINEFCDYLLQGLSFQQAKKLRLSIIRDNQQQRRIKGCCMEASVCLALLGSFISGWVGKWRGVKQLQQQLPKHLARFSICCTVQAMRMALLSIL